MAERVTEPSITQVSSQPRAADGVWGENAERGRLRASDPTFGGLRGDSHGADRPGTGGEHANVPDDRSDK